MFCSRPDPVLGFNIILFLYLLKKDLNNEISATALLLGVLKS